MKKAFALLLTLLLLSVFTLSAAAVDVQRGWSITDLGQSVAFTPDSQEATFWEWPDIQPGQTRKGLLGVSNTTERTVAVYMNGAALPFDDRDALTYLNFVTLTIKNTDGVVLFSDRYVRLADWKAEVGELAPNESVTWLIEMHCDFAFDGETAMPQAIHWQFAGAPQGAMPMPVVPPAETPWVATILAVGAAAVLIGCVALRWMPKSRKNSKKAQKTS